MGYRLTQVVAIVMSWVHWINVGRTSATFTGVQTAQLDRLLEIYRQSQEQLKTATRSMHHVIQVANDT